MLQARQYNSFIILDEILTGVDFFVAIGIIIAAGFVSTALGEIFIPISSSDDMLADL